MARLDGLGDSCFDFFLYSLLALDCVLLLLLLLLMLVLDFATMESSVSLLLENDLESVVIRNGVLVVLAMSLVSSCNGSGVELDGVDDGSLF